MAFRTRTGGFQTSSVDVSEMRSPKPDREYRSWHDGPQCQHVYLVQSSDEAESEIYGIQIVTKWSRRRIKGYSPSRWEKSFGTTADAGRRPWRNSGKPERCALRGDENANENQPKLLSCTHSPSLVAHSLCDSGRRSSNNSTFSAGLHISILYST